MRGGRRRAVGDGCRVHVYSYDEWAAHELRPFGCTYIVLVSSGIQRVQSHPSSPPSYSTCLAQPSATFGLTSQLEAINAVTNVILFVPRARHSFRYVQSKLAEDLHRPSRCHGPSPSPSPRPAKSERTHPQHPCPSPLRSLSRSGRPSRCAVICRAGRARVIRTELEKSVRVNELRAGKKGAQPIRRPHILDAAQRSSEEAK